MTHGASYFVSSAKKKNKRKQKTLQQPSADDGSADCSVPGSDDLPMEEWA